MVLDSEAPNYFELFPANYDTMMVTAKSKNGAELIMPAVIHQDGTARIQLVNELTNPEIFEVLNTFFIKTNCPAMINTSFNVRGEPIVESPLDALRVLLYTDIDLLVFNNSIWVDKNFDLEKVRKQIKMITYAAD
jgi:carbamoyltransferase